MNRRIVLAVVTFAAFAVTEPVVQGQIYTGPTIPAGKYGSYTDYYNKNVTNPGFEPVNPREFNRDKYIYQNPVLSPYLDLTNRQEGVLPNYFNYVAPAEQAQQTPPYSRNLRARAAALNGADPLNGVGYTPYGPAHMPSAEPYYNNHWYGGWSR